MGTGGHNVPLILSNHGIRKLTPRETFNVQGFPEDFKLPEIANGQLYKQAGNSVIVPVIKRIAEKIADALDKSSKLSKSEYINIDSDKDILIYVDMKSRYEGESFVKQCFENKKQIDEYIKTTCLSIVSDEEYEKIVKKHIVKRFYSLKTKNEE